MLENSSLSKKIVIVPDNVVRKCVVGLKNDPIAFEQMRNRLIWPQKEELEKNQIWQLFGENLAGFIIESPKVRFCFDRSADIGPKQIQMTSSSIGQIQQGSDILVQTFYTNQIITSKSKINCADGVSDANNQKLELLVPRRTTGLKLNRARREDKIEPDRLLISLGKEVDKKSPALKTFERMMQQNYGSIIDTFISTQTENQTSYGSSFNARFISGVSSSAGSKFKLKH